MFRNNLHSLNNNQSTPSQGKVTSQPITQVSSINPALLESISEYRSLKQELAQKRQPCITRSDDYMKFKEEFNKYRASSFRERFSLFSYCLMIFPIARPSVDGLKFLLQLVENLTVSTTSIGNHTRSQLAKAVVLSEEELTGCYHPNPQ